MKELRFVTKDIAQYVYLVYNFPVQIMLLFT